MTLQEGTDWDWHTYILQGRDEGFFFFFFYFIFGRWGVFTLYFFFTSLFFFCCCCFLLAAYVREISFVYNFFPSLSTSSFQNFTAYFTFYLLSIFTKNPPIPSLSLYFLGAFVPQRGGSFLG